MLPVCGKSIITSRAVNDVVCGPILTPHRCDIALLRGGSLEVFMYDSDSGKVRSREMTFPIIERFSALALLTTTSTDTDDMTSLFATLSPTLTSTSSSYAAPVSLNANKKCVSQIVALSTITGLAHVYRFDERLHSLVAEEPPTLNDHLDISEEFVITKLLQHFERFATCVALCCIRVPPSSMSAVSSSSSSSLASSSSTASALPPITTTKNTETKPPTASTTTTTTPKKKKHTHVGLDRGGNFITLEQSHGIYVVDGQNRSVCVIPFSEDATLVDWRFVERDLSKARRSEKKTDFKKEECGGGGGDDHEEQEEEEDKKEKHEPDHCFEKKKQQDTNVILVIAYVPHSVLPTSGRYAIEGHKCVVATFSINFTTSSVVCLWRAENLPSSCVRVLPLDNNGECTLVVGAELLLVLRRSMVVSALPLNARGTRELKDLIETSTSTSDTQMTLRALAKEYARYYTSPESPFYTLPDPVVFFIGQIGSSSARDDEAGKKKSSTKSKVRRDIDDDDDDDDVKKKNIVERDESKEGKTKKEEKQESQKKKQKEQQKENEMSYRKKDAVVLIGSKHNTDVVYDLQINMNTYAMRFNPTLLSTSRRSTSHVKVAAHTCVFDSVICRLYSREFLEQEKEETEINTTRSTRTTTAKQEEVEKKKQRTRVANVFIASKLGASCVASLFYVQKTNRLVVEVRDTLFDDHMSGPIVDVTTLSEIKLSRENRDDDDEDGHAPKKKTILPKSMGGNNNNNNSNNNNNNCGGGILTVIGGYKNGGYVATRMPSIGTHTIHGEIEKINEGGDLFDMQHLWPLNLCWSFSTSTGSTRLKHKLLCAVTYISSTNHQLVWLSESGCKNVDYDSGLDTYSATLELMVLRDNIVMQHMYDGRVIIYECNYEKGADKDDDKDDNKDDDDADTKEESRGGGGGGGGAGGGRKFLFTRLCDLSLIHHRKNLSMAWWKMIRNDSGHGRMPFEPCYSLSKEEEEEEKEEVHTKLKRVGALFFCGPLFVALVESMPRRWELRKFDFVTPVAQHITPPTPTKPTPTPTSTKPRPRFLQLLPEDNLITSCASVYNNKDNESYLITCMYSYDNEGRSKQVPKHQIRQHYNKQHEPQLCMIWRIDFQAGILVLRECLSNLQDGACLSESDLVLNNFLFTVVKPPDDDGKEEHDHDHDHDQKKKEEKEEEEEQKGEQKHSVRGYDEKKEEEEEKQKSEFVLLNDEKKSSIMSTSSSSFSGSSPFLFSSSSSSSFSSSSRDHESSQKNKEKYGTAVRAARQVEIVQLLLTRSHTSSLNPLVLIVRTTFGNVYVYVQHSDSDSDSQSSSVRSALSMSTSSSSSSSSSSPLLQSFSFSTASWIRAHVQFPKFRNIVNVYATTNVLAWYSKPRTPTTFCVVEKNASTWVCLDTFRVARTSISNAVFCTRSDPFLLPNLQQNASSSAQFAFEMGYTEDGSSNSLRMISASVPRSIFSGFSVQSTGNGTPRFMHWHTASSVLVVAVCYDRVKQDRISTSTKNKNKAYIKNGDSENNNAYTADNDSDENNDDDDDDDDNDNDDNDNDASGDDDVNKEKTESWSLLCFSYGSGKSGGGGGGGGLKEVARYDCPKRERITCVSSYSTSKYCLLSVGIVKQLDNRIWSANICGDLSLFSISSTRKEKEEEKEEHEHEHEHEQEEKEKEKDNNDSDDDDDEDQEKEVTKIIERGRLSHIQQRIGVVSQVVQFHQDLLAVAAGKFLYLVTWIPEKKETKLGDSEEAKNKEDKQKSQKTKEKEEQGEKEEASGSLRVVAACNAGVLCTALRAAYPLLYWTDVSQGAKSIEVVVYDERLQSLEILALRNMRTDASNSVAPTNFAPLYPYNVYYTGASPSTSSSYSSSSSSPSSSTPEYYSLSSSSSSSVSSVQSSSSSSSSCLKLEVDSTRSLNQAIQNLHDHAIWKKTCGTIAHSLVLIPTFAWHWNSVGSTPSVPKLTSLSSSSFSSLSSSSSSSSSPLTSSSVFDSTSISGSLTTTATTTTTPKYKHPTSPNLQLWTLNQDAHALDYNARDTMLLAHHLAWTMQIPRDYHSALLLKDHLPLQVRKHIYIATTHAHRLPFSVCNMSLMYSPTPLHNRDNGSLSSGGGGGGSSSTSTSSSSFNRLSSHSDSVDTSELSSINNNNNNRGQYWAWITTKCGSIRKMHFMCTNMSRTAHLLTRWHNALFSARSACFFNTRKNELSFAERLSQTALQSLITIASCTTSPRLPRPTIDLEAMQKLLFMSTSEKRLIPVARPIDSENITAIVSASYIAS